MSNTITKDNTLYIPIREVSGILGVDITYDPEMQIAHIEKNSNAQGIVKQAELYPVSVETYDTPTGKTLIKRYELTAGQNPSGIPKADFEKEGYTYKFQEIIKESLVIKDEKETTETLTLQTKGNNINDIIKEVPEYQEFTTDDGYKGMLKLDVSSIQTGVSGYKNYSYTEKETRTYPGFATTDLSVVPKTITKNGKTLTLQNVEWKSVNTETIDYYQLSDNYTAVATYSANATGRSVNGYNTTAGYTGYVTKIETKGTVYTAYFTGTVVSVEQARQIEKEAKAYEKLLNKATKKGLTVGEYLKSIGGETIDGEALPAMSVSDYANIKKSFPWLPLVLLIILGFVLFILFLRFLAKDMTIYSYNNENEKYMKIDRVKLRYNRKQKQYLFDLSEYNNETSTHRYQFKLSRFLSFKTNHKKICFNYINGQKLEHGVNCDIGNTYEFTLEF